MNTKDNTLWCVYAHVNKINGKIYIGISSNIKNRWRVSAYDKTQAIRVAFDKYGWDNFKHIILIENLSKIMAQECEKYLIKKYNSQNKDIGYNRSPGGELIQVLCGVDSPYSKTTYQYDLDGNFIKEWVCARDAEQELGLTNITACCRGEYKKHGNWQWSYEYVDHMDKYIPPDYTQYNWASYPRVYKYSTSGEFLEIIDDVHVFKDVNYRRAVVECCKGIRVQAGGYIWLFENDVSNEKIKDIVCRYQKAYRSVNQYDLDGKYIQTFLDAKEAAHYLRGCKTAINHACSGKSGEALGYQWRYVFNSDGKNDIEPYNNTRCKTIIQYNLDGDYVQTWESIKSAKQQYGRKVADALYTRKTHQAYGYLWFYETDFEKYKDEFNLENPTYDE